MGNKLIMHPIFDFLISIQQLERCPWEIYLYEKKVDSASQEIMLMNALLC